jgi:DNA-binding transcriptional ArsR family regulator
MTLDDQTEFFAIIADAHAFWRKDFSKFTGTVWWNAMKPYPLDAVVEALGRHSVNPDEGHFAPFPADIVKMLEGSTQDAALVAWTKVDRAIRSVGSHYSVVFDDGLIHRIITEMGGWVEFGRKDEKEWPFVRNEFVNRYRGYRMRSETPDYLPVLVGIAEAQNSRIGQAIQAPVFVGDAASAKRVMQGAKGGGLVGVTRSSMAGASTAEVGMLGGRA